MPFITDTPNSEMKPIAAEMLNSRPVTYSAMMPPPIGERDAGQRQQAVAQRIEQAVQQHQDQHQADRARRPPAVLGALQVLEFAGPDEAIAGRQFDVLGDPLLRFRDGAAKVAAAHAELDREKALVAFVVDVGGAGIERDRRRVRAAEYRRWRRCGV